MPGSIPKIISSFLICKCEVTTKVDNAATIFTVRLKKIKLRRRYKRALNFIIGPLLFIILSWAIYHKINQQYSWQQIQTIFANAFNKSNRVLLLFLFILMIINWMLEAAKWKMLMKPVQPVSMLTACKAVFSGLSFSMFIPTAAGEYAGRTLYMHEGNRLRSLSLNIIGSISQLLVTLVAGVAGIFYLKKMLLDGTASSLNLSIIWLNGLLYAVIAAIIVFALIYFQMAPFTRWFEKIPFIQRHLIFVQNLEAFGLQQLTQILLLSVLRYVVFIVQYWLVFQLFGVQMAPVEAAFATAVLLLILSAIPSVPNIAELGVRGEVSRQLFGMLSANAAGIVFSAAFIWIVNLIIPAIAGSLFLMGIKIFRNK